MKRTFDGHQPPQKIELPSCFPSPTANVNGPTPPKRQKSSHACSSCRKHKTRCELIDSNASASGSQRCHRCNVLNMPCSFDHSTVSSGLPSSSKESSSTPGLGFNSPPDSPESNARYVNPEDVISAPIMTPWGFGKGLGSSDWTATPMVVLQELARRPNSAQNMVTNFSDLSLVDIIPPDQLHYLLGV
jgi:hypothetical protein